MAEFFSTGSSVDIPLMSLGARIEERRKQIGIPSQSELARRASMNQTTLNSLINSNARWSPDLPRIARQLRTSIDYLVGETDDPDENAPPPPPEPTVQLVTLQVALPSEAALTRMFEGLLAGSRRLDEAALAHELAKRLPRALQLLKGPLIEPLPVASEPPIEAPEAPPSGRRAAGQGRRK